MPSKIRDFFPNFLPRAINARFYGLFRNTKQACRFPLATPVEGHKNQRLTKPQGEMFQFAIDSGQQVGID